MKSHYKKLNFRDISKGFIVAFIAAFLTTIEQIVSQSVMMGFFDLSWSMAKPALVIGLTSGISYILKNLFTNSKDRFFKSES